MNNEQLTVNNVELTHFNEQGRAKMVDVSGKAKTARAAVAWGTVALSAETFALVRDGKMEKGDVLAVAQVAGILGAKRTAELIPMCHPVGLTAVDISFALDENTHSIGVKATAKCVGETGVEMEALTAVSVAALTVYDMCKSAQRDIVIGEIKLISKSGGKSGDWKREE